MNLNKHTGLPYMIQDLGMRLSHSLVMYDGRPFFISEVEGTTLLGTDTLTGKAKSVGLPAPLLDIRPVLLGYVNGREHATYCSRMPHRRYKQGLNSANLLLQEGARIRDKTSLIQSKAMAQCVLDKYPSLDEVYDEVSNAKRHSRAFHRYWSLHYTGGEIGLNYRGLHVGAFKAGNLKLMESFSYLKEELGESV